MTPQSPVQQNRWQRFASLRWFDSILDFVFSLTAKSSEVLLAAGVILSTANHFQHGSLFMETSNGHGQSQVANTPLFGIWTWTQAIGFEASAGVVLALALDAHRSRDSIKRNVLLSVMAGLALVGTTMLVMAFIEASTTFRESDLPASYGITMSIIRGVVSVAYVTVGRVKHRRFSEPSDGPNTTLSVTHDPLELVEQIRTVSETMNQRLDHMTKTLERLGMVSEPSATLAQAIERIKESLDERTKQEVSGATDHLAKALAPYEQALAMLPTLVASLGQIERNTTAQLRTVVEEVVDVKTTLLQHSAHPLLAQSSSHLFAEDTPLASMLILPPSVQRSRPQPPGENHISISFAGEPEMKAQRFNEPILSDEKSVSQQRDEHAPSLFAPATKRKTKEALVGTVVSEPKQANRPFDRKAFVQACLTEHPAMRNTEIQRKAIEMGYTLSAGYISDIRKMIAAKKL